jgi:TonB family protein
MYKLIPLLVLIGFLNAAFGQQRQNVYFLKNNGTEVSVKDSADFIRIIAEPDSGTVYFKLTEVYPDGKKKAIGTLSGYNPLFYEGPYVSYYTNGKPETRVNYKKNDRIGLGYEFYRNGKLKAIKDYPEPTQDFWAYLEPKLIFFADSTGAELVKNGNGHFISKYLFQNIDEVIEKGDYSDGLKVNTWTFKYLNKNWSYKEQFNKGKFVSGESLIDGVSHEYKEVNESAEYPGGTDAFYKKVTGMITYPKDAAQKGIEGKVFLSYIIESDGTVNNIKIERRLFPSLDTEAIRVIKYLSGTKWKPERKHGIPISIKYNMPVNFSVK